MLKSIKRRLRKRKNFYINCKIILSGQKIHVKFDDPNELATLFKVYTGVDLRECDTTEDFYKKMYNK